MKIVLDWCLKISNYDDNFKLQNESICVNLYAVIEIVMRFAENSFLEKIVVLDKVSLYLTFDELF